MLVFTHLSNNPLVRCSNWAQKQTGDLVVFCLDGVVFLTYAVNSKYDPGLLEAWRKPVLS